MEWWGNSYRFGTSTASPLVVCDFGNSSSYPGAGTTITNLGTSGGNGTLTNGPTYSSSDGGVLTLNGTNQYVQFSDTGNSIIPSNGLTIIAWTKTSVTDRFLVDKGGGALEGAGYVLYFSGGGNIQFSINNTTVTTTLASQANGQWMMLSAIWMPSTSMTIRRNTTSMTTTATGVTPSAISISSYSLRWGGRALGAADHWNGSISRLVIDSRAWSNAELSTEFNAYRARYGL